VANLTTIPNDESDIVLSRRTDEELERDRVIIARMYVRGKSQHEMMLEINKLYSERKISSQLIHLDLESIRRAWLNSTLVDFNAAKSKELARLDECEREAFDAWDRSKEKHVRIEYEITDDQVPFSMDKVADIKRKKKKKIIEATVGDIRYLEIVERMIDTRCKILGLFEAAKIQIDWRLEAQAAGMDEETIDAVKERTVQVLLEAISQAGKDSGAIKESEIIDAVMEDK
jgi:hypothetical protein